MQRAGQANAVPLGPFKNNNGYANKAMPLGSPAPFVWIGMNNVYMYGSENKYMYKNQNDDM